MLRDSDPGVRESALNALIAIGGRSVAESVAPLLREESALLRNMGIEILELIGPEAFPAIASLLNDPDDDVVKFGVDIIANTREERAIGMLFALINHANPNVRASVAVCLGRLKAVSSVPVLLSALNDSEEWVRFSAVEGLGLIQDRRALTPLLKLIEVDSGLIKEAAIDAAGRIASADDAATVLLKLEPLVKKGKIFNVPAVMELLEKAMTPGSSFRHDAEFKKTYFNMFARAVEESDRSEKLKALKGIALLKAPEGLQPVFNFIDSLNDIDEDTEEFLVDTIVSITGRGPLPKIFLERLAKGGKSLKIIVRTLGELKSREAVPILKELIGKVAKHELREVAAALEAIGSPGSVEVLYQSLKNSDGHTRKIAARALASLAGPVAVPSLFEALRSEMYRDVMEEVTDVLSMIPSESVKKGLCGLLASDKEALREMGARGLGSIGDEESLGYLVKAAADPSPAVRKAVYKSMARLGIPNAVDEIVKGLEDTDDDVKLSVMKGLGGWTGERIKSALLSSLRDRNIWVRYHAVVLLGEFGDLEVEDMIIEKLLKDEAPVKAAAAKALERLGAHGAAVHLEQFLNHPDPSVRGAVESALESLGC
jgi:HEAT repeat protein